MDTHPNFGLTSLSLPNIHNPPSPSEVSSQYSSSDTSFTQNIWISTPSHDSLNSCAPRDSRRPSSATRTSKPDPKITIVHPYARLFAKKDDVKRRKIWNHALEKSLFSPYELSTVGAPQRRRIYMSSLEAHIDQLHAQLLGMGYWPVQLSTLEPFKGLNSKTAKSMVAGLQHDASLAKLKLLELERANHDLEKLLRAQS